MPSEDEYVAELVNTDYVVREKSRHSMLCSGVVHSKFKGNVMVLRRRKYYKRCFYCTVCEWKVVAVIKENKG